MIYGKLPVTFLSAVASEKQGSTNSVIAGYILEHLPEMQSLGIQDMAEKCHVSPASLSRFCKEIGLHDFSELRDLLADPKLEFQRQPGFAACAESACESIRLAVDSVDAGAVRELCRDLQTYKRAAAFGLLKAGTAAISLQGDLLMLGKQLYTNISYHQQINYIREAGPEDLILIFSYTGTYFDSLERPPETKAKIWMISGQERKYPRCVSRALHFSSRHDQAGHPYQLLAVAGVIAQEYAKVAEDGRSGKAE